MYDQGSSYNNTALSGQGPRASMPPPTYLQRLPSAIPCGFQQGPMMPLPSPPVNVQPHRGQQGMPMYHGHSPKHLNFGVPQGGPPLLGFQGAPFSNFYQPAQPAQLGMQQHYFAGPPPLPPTVQGSQRQDMMQPSLPPRGLPPPPSQGHLQHQALQPVALGVNLPPPPHPPHSSSSVVSNYAPGSLMDSNLGDSQMTVMANPPSLLQPPQNSSPPPTQSSTLPSVTAGSPADSDMEMEDDITQFENELSANLNNTEDASCSPDFTGCDFEVKEPFHVPQTSAKCGGLISLPNKVREQVALGAAVCVDSDQSFAQGVKGGSPIRLLQGYASDDSSETYEKPCMRDANHQAISHADGAAIFQEITRLKVEANSVSPSLQKTDLENSSNLHHSHELQTELEKSASSFWGRGVNSEHADGCENQASVSHVTHYRPSEKEDPSSNVVISLDLVHKNLVIEEEKDENFASDSHKIDEFGRLVRECSSDNESADSGHAGRHNRRGKNHSCSPSHSRSPQDRSWKRRSSPRRRREKRSRSRSWSPRRRRIRSRSPLFRRAEFNTSTTRRGEARMRDCFDFLRGKCYRESYCRYLHHDYEKSDGPRSHRNKQQYPQSSHSKNPSTDKEIKKISGQVSDCKQECLNQEAQLGQDMHIVGDMKESSIIYDEESSAGHPMKCASSIEDVKLADVDAIKPERVRGAVAEVSETKVVHRESEFSWTDVDCNSVEETKSPFGDVNIVKSHIVASQGVAFTLKDSTIQKCQSDLSCPLLESVHRPLQQTDVSIISDLSSDKNLGTSPKKHDTSGALTSSEDTACTPPQMPLPPYSAPLLEAMNASHVVQLGRDQNLIPQTASFEPQCAALGNVSVLMNQNSLFPVPTDTASPTLSRPPPPSLPLPRPTPLLSSSYRTVDNGSALHSHPLQFQQTHLPPVNDDSSQMFLRPYTTEFHVHSQGFSASDSVTLAKNFPPPFPLHEMNSVKVSPFPASFVSPRGNFASSFPGRLYSQQQAGGLSQPVSHNFNSVPGKVTSFMAPPDLVDPNQAPCLPDLSVPRRSTHYNPYASTFEKPLSSRFNTDVLWREKDTLFSSKLDHHFNFSHASNDGLVGGSVGTRQLTSSPNSDRHFGQTISPSGDDQYDPLFDSIEPSSNSFKKGDHTQKWEAFNDSENMLRHSNKPLDVEEKNKNKEVGSIAVTTSIDDEEFGETADAEIGDVENASQSNPNEPMEVKMGEMEIVQSTSLGKWKKIKDSRSMKLFKVALADFVKEVLKPSWQQGNMSKEAFKIVVKKTVDKVAGAIKGHRVPKSKAKINQYIDSSQRKLTKLVMGYVDKYAKG